MLGLSFLLMLVSVVSYLRIKDIKMLFLVAAFSLFFVKGIFLLAEAAHQSLILIVFDLLIIVFLYLTVVRR